MLWFKGCPRCQGDLANDRDRYGVYRYCLQCGYCEELRPARALPQAQAAPPEGTYA